MPFEPMNNILCKSTANTILKRCPSRNVSYVAILAFIIVGVLIRFSFLVGAEPIITNDTNAYQRMMEEGIVGNVFFGDRPFGYPLILRIFAYDWSLVVLFQRVVSIAAWLFLSLTLAGTFRNRATKYFGSIIIYIFGMSAAFLCWDIFVLTESLSISVFCTICGFLLLYRPGKSNIAMLAAIALFSLYFAVLRDANIYLLPFLIIYLAVSHFLVFYRNASVSDEKNQKMDLLIRVLIIAVVLCIFFFLRHESYASKRWVAPLYNSMNKKVLVQMEGNMLVSHEEHMAYFVEEKQMPFRESIPHLGKHYSQNTEDALIYMRWLREKGYQSYKNFLVSHWPYMAEHYFFEPEITSMDIKNLSNIKVYMQWKDNRRIFNQTIIGKYNKWQLVFEYIFNLPLRIASPAILQILGMFACLFIYFSHSFSKCTPFSRTARLSALTSLLFGFAALINFIAVFGDAIETWRHSLLSTLAYMLAVMIILLSLMDAIIIRIYTKE